MYGWKSGKHSFRRLRTPGAKGSSIRNLCAKARIESARNFVYLSFVTEKQIGQGYSIGELTDIVKARPDAVWNIVSVPDASQTVPAFFIDPVLNVKVEKVF